VKRNITTGNVFENSGNNAVPRIRVGKKQEIETLINEEALLFAMFLEMKSAHGLLELLD
jgi:hypothetical protein